MIHQQGAAVALCNKEDARPLRRDSRRWPWVSGCAALFCLVTPALAQTEVERFNRRLEQIQRQQRLQVSDKIPAEQRTLVEYGGYFTFNLLLIDDRDQETHYLRQYDLNAFARVNIDGAHEFFFRGRTAYRDFNTSDDFDRQGDEFIDPQLQRGYYKFDLQRSVAAYQGEAINGNVELVVGRQLIHWANGLTLSQPLDAIDLILSYDIFSVELLAGHTPEWVVDIDSSRPDFDDDTDRAFYGVVFRSQVSANHKPHVFGLIQKDQNRNRVLVIDPIRTNFDYDSNYIGVGSIGNLSQTLLYGTELVFQQGEGLSNSFDPIDEVQLEQRHEDIHAYALDLRLDYAPNSKRGTRMGIEMALASGDTDRFHTTNTFGGNKAGTHDRAFNAFGFINTGLAFAPNVSNLLLLRAGASTFPTPDNATFKRLQVGGDLFGFFKTEDDGPLNEPTDGEAYLGMETDFFVNWQVTSDLVLAARYGVFFPGEAIEADNDARHFFYVGATIAF